MRRFSISWPVLTLILATCAHIKPVANMETLHSASETYHRLVRWGDFRSAAEMVATDQRNIFLKKIVDFKAEENIKIIDYKLLDARSAPGTAKVTSEVTWHTLPSITTHTETMTMIWEDHEGIWFIRSIQGGPISLL